MYLNQGYAGSELRMDLIHLSMNAIKQVLQWGNGGSVDFTANADIENQMSLTTQLP